MKIYLAVTNVLTCLNISTNLWACWVRWKAARPVPNWLHILRRCIQLGTVGRPEAGHDFCISCPQNILPQNWSAARVCIHLGAVCHVGILCRCSRIGFHWPTGNIHLHLQNDMFLICANFWHLLCHIKLLCKAIQSSNLTRLGHKILQPAIGHQCFIFNSRCTLKFGPRYGTAQYNKAIDNRQKCWRVRRTLCKC
jgi:hypothetical protein